jgi:hypothetical protein
MHDFRFPAPVKGLCWEEGELGYERDCEAPDPACLDPFEGRTLKPQRFELSLVGVVGDGGDRGSRVTFNDSSGGGRARRRPRGLFWGSKESVR